MPSAASLAARQYYAHPQNAFWIVMGEILGFAHGIAYARRVAELKRAGVALWDVLARCEREGSLDSSIRTATEEPNDVGELLAGRPSIRAVFLNGGKAESAFGRYVAPTLRGAALERLHVERLPSTSPANASLTRARKTQRWRRAMAGFLE